MGDEEFGRRTLLELIGGLAFLAACSDATPDAQQAPTPSSGASVAAPDSAPAAATTTSGATTSSAVSATTAPTIDNNVVATTGKLADEVRATAEQLQTERDKIEGTWLGSWSDDQGRSGNVDGIFDVGVADRYIDFTLKIDGPFLGGSAPTTTTYHLDADAISRHDDDIVLQSPLIGPFTMQFLGFGQFQLAASQVPNRPDITSVVIKGAWENLTSGTLAYQVSGTGPAAGRGAAAWSRSGLRPPPPSLVAADDPTLFIGGDFAAGLLQPAEVSAIFGVHVTTVDANGGTPSLPGNPTIKVSNARAVSDDGSLVLQYSLFRSPDVASSLQYWQTLVHGPDVPDLGAPVTRAALPGRPGPAGYNALLGRDVLYLEVLSLEQNPLPAATLEAFDRQLIKLIVPRLSD